MLNKHDHLTKFDTYAARYDLTDGRINLKILHTKEVCKVMDALTASLNLPQHTKDLAWLCALYHDISRFEQITKFGTFVDALSFDHGDTGALIIDEEGFLADQAEDDRRKIKTAIRRHNKYEIGAVEDEETLVLCKLIRDADKCDIFRVFAFEDMVDTMGETIEQVSKETITDVVMDSVLAHRCVVKEQRKTGLDKWIGFLGFIYDLNFPESVRIVKEQGYYRMPFDQAHFTDPETAVKVQEILADLESYIQIS